MPQKNLVACNFTTSKTVRFLPPSPAASRQSVLRLLKQHHHQWSSFCLQGICKILTILLLHSLLQLPLTFPPLPSPSLLPATLITIVNTLAALVITLAVACYSHCQCYCPCPPCHHPLCLPPPSLPSPLLLSAILIAVVIILAALAVTVFVACYLVTVAIAHVVAVAIVIVPVAHPQSLLLLPLLLPPLPLFSVFLTTLSLLPSQRCLALCPWRMKTP